MRTAVSAKKSRLSGSCCTTEALIDVLVGKGLVTKEEVLKRMEKVVDGEQ